MKKLIVLFLWMATTYAGHAQKADDLNRQANDFIARGDIKNGVEFLKQAAALGQPEAQYNLGVFYQEGRGVEKNDSIGSGWILSAAESGWRDARYKISYCYAGGKGVEKSLEKAFEWMEKCAWLVDPECMYTVSECYKDGVGTTVSPDSMVAWYIRLGKLENPKELIASQFISIARLSLATMYRDGNLVKKDKLKSYIWFLLYNERKKDFDAVDQKGNIAAIKKHEKNLRESEKRKAIEEAAILTGRPLKNLTNLHKEE